MFELVYEKTHQVRLMCRAEMVFVFLLLIVSCPPDGHCIRLKLHRQRGKKKRGG